MAKRRVLTDPVFGRVSWEIYWKGRTATKTLGKTVELTIESPDGAPPTDAQKSAYAAFLKCELALVEDIAAAHLRYYKKTRKLFSAHFDIDFLDELMPPVESAAEVKRQLSLPTVHIPQQPRRGWQVDLQWECDWDAEHGHEVTIRNGKVARVGMQGG